MSKHRRETVPTASGEHMGATDYQPRHRASLCHWYNTCPSVGEQDTLATEQTQVNCPTCIEEYVAQQH